MKPFFVVFGLICILSTFSCNNELIPLEQTYQDNPYEFSVSATKDEVWTKLVQLLTSKGLAIKTIDKSNGLITTDNISFLNSYSFENNDGGLTNPNAFVVCTKVRGPFTFTASLKPDAISGQWTVLTKQADDKTLVDIKLANASGKVVVEDADTRETHNLTVTSTGVFEKSVQDALLK